MRRSQLESSIDWPDVSEVEVVHRTGHQSTQFNPRQRSASVPTTRTPGDGSTSPSATAPHAFDVSYSTAVAQRRFRSDADDDDRSTDLNTSFHEQSGATVAEIFYKRFLEPFGFSFERDDSESTETFEKLLLEFLKGSDFPDVFPFPCPPLTSRNTKIGGDNESKRCTSNYSACLVSRRWKYWSVTPCYAELSVRNSSRRI